MEKDLISIIIPVYNVEKYLKECVDSVRKQTYKNLEIILIDDGSKDNSGKLCDELAKEDNRIKVIHKENGGLSDARNVGIENATGEYIQFIDSDDFVEKDMIEILHNDICQEKADVSMCSLYLYKDGEKTTDASYKREIFNKELVLKEILLDERVRSYAWNKMFKKSLFESIRFPKGKVFEDIYTMSPIFQKANKIVFNDIPLYYYRQREGSILHNQTNELRLEYIKAAMFVNKDIEKNFPNLKDFCAYNIAHITIKTYNDIGFFGMFDLMEEEMVINLYEETKKIFDRPISLMASVKQYNEEIIIEQLHDPGKCRDAFTRVIEHYSEPLYWQIRRMVIDHDDANDLLQNTFIKAWTNIDNFRGDAKLSTWLYKIAINESITFINKEKAKNNVSIDDESFLVNNLEADEWFDGDEIKLRLQKAINLLPEKQRLVFNMRYFDEMKYEDMSEILGTSVGALKASYHHALKKIEQFFSSDD